MLVGCAVGGCSWACSRRPRVLVGCAVGGCWLGVL